MSSNENSSNRLYRDTEGAEVAHVLRACPLQRYRLIEIGCGEGFLTWKLSRHAAPQAAIDPNLDRLHAAQVARPPDLPAVSFAQARAEALPFPPGSFDAAIFAHSL
ncbi:MAG TPA: class I SAM-dependent methyltransferase [Anaerolineales bacterium]